MEQWLADTFPTVMGAAAVYESGEVVITVDPAASAGAGGIFASISAANPPTYAQLTALACATQGWQRIFDAWKAAGKVA